MKNNSIKFMNVAILEAKKAFLENEIPVGAVIVKNNQIIAKAHNKKEKLKNVLAHAEILAIQKANKNLNNWRLLNCELYVTLKPCQMCMHVIHQSRIKKIFYVLDNYERLNKKNINMVIVNNDKIKKKVEAITSLFFQQKRN